MKELRLEGKAVELVTGAGAMDAAFLVLSPEYLMAAVVSVFTLEASDGCVGTTDRGYRSRRVN